ncbi:N-acetyl-gamma-glutamyl-phosphate reductase, ArgC [Pontimonas salivibrio]|uniref:N-acetyl-gamma-glutamyl-phosphate reductase n=1 Tax=Pontimonas salivibrio TaxID=1159327 RepID=A0A2L2BR97_9MICO|nr:N-acetyl-gamma-glutamyl-phosphate reductase [Pontimonas salivibrio]AVG24157.1 N-acetyl-gamma-glutamyl-phosphate reductase, ArgC [Pontimonas salivibrio]
MTRIAVVGASGYAGGEIARLISSHPHFELGTLTADRNEGRPVRQVHPHLRTLGDQTFSGIDIDVLSAHDVVVLALPHGHSGALGETLAHARPELTLVDLGADRRLNDPEAWERYYGGTHYDPWVYGMPELVLADGQTQRSRLAGATRIVAPGCNATAVTLALAPLIRAGQIEPADIVSTLSVAPSGAGRALKEELLASERLSSAAAYAVAGSHRHIPEVIQNLSNARVSGVSEGMSVSLTPVLVPMSRGILAVNTARVAPGNTGKTLHDTLVQSYGSEAFIDVLPDGELPGTGSVLGSNTVALGIGLDPATQRVTVVSAIDNLYKGTAGAAVQSLNIALGLEETAGLESNGVAP